MTGRNASRPGGMVIGHSQKQLDRARMTGNPEVTSKIECPDRRQFGSNSLGRKTCRAGGVQYRIRRQIPEKRLLPLRKWSQHRLLWCKKRLPRKEAAVVR